MAQRIYHEQAYNQQAQYKDLLQSQLQLLENKINQPLEAYAQHFQTLAPNILSKNAQKIRQIIRDDPIITQILIFSKNQPPSFPPIAEQSSQQEKDFLQRTVKIRQENLFEQTNNQEETNASPIKQQGWYRWHWENGTNLLFWIKDKQHRVIAFELDFMGLLSDIMGELPSNESPALCGQLINSNDQIIYEWGASNTQDFIPASQLTLPAPLDNWHLSYQVHPNEWQANTQQNPLIYIIGISGLSLALLLLGFYLYREFTRNLREASQRVNFVNQVSHELRTPLTNIQLYAELLQSNPDLTPKDQHKLHIIISESLRLGRLISNILSYARQQKKNLKIHPKQSDVVELIHNTLEQFSPSLAQKNIQIKQQGLTEKICHLDPDALSQILGNLFSNVEKYGKHQLCVTLSQEKEHLIIQVHDDGDSIATSQRSQIFQPFYRINNTLTEGISGTGIGLSISRQLAQLHGGDLSLIATEKGNLFQCTLPCPTKEHSS